MPHFSESIDIERPPEDVWAAIGTPERWFEGYLETRSRSADYPGPDTRDDHLYRTRVQEEVGAHVTRSEAPSVLEEDQEGKTFSRHVRYSLTPSPTGPRCGWRTTSGSRGSASWPRRSPPATSRSAGRPRSRS